MSTKQNVERKLRLRHANEQIERGRIIAAGGAVPRSLPPHPFIFGVAIGNEWRTISCWHLHVRRTTIASRRDEGAFCDCPLFCKFCGARLRRDAVGHYCPMKNCQWRYGAGNCLAGLKKEKS